MKNYKLKETMAKMYLNKPSTGSIITGKTCQNDNTPYKWEVSYIDSKQHIYTEHGIFHFEMILRCQDNEKKPATVSKIKVCPHTIKYKDILYTFFINPVDKVTVCRSNPNIVIKWKEGYFSNNVIDIKELNPDEQFNKHKVLLENFVERVYLPEIFAEFEKQEFIESEAERGHIIL